MRDPASAREPRLRPARAGEGHALRTMIDACGLFVEGIPDDPDDAWVVAVEGDRVVGGAGVEVHGSHGLLRSVVVASDRRGGGLGGRLVADRVAWARGRRLETLSLLTIGPGTLFLHAGFREVPRAALPGALSASPEMAHARCAGARAFTRAPGAS